MQELDLTIEVVPETGDDRYTLKYGKTLVIFDGHAAPDTTVRSGRGKPDLVGRGRRLYRLAGLGRSPPLRRLTGSWGRSGYKGRGTWPTSSRPLPSAS
jgi:hypothetical protein